MSITGTVGMAIKTQKAPGSEEGQASLHGGGHIGNRTVDGSRDSTDCVALKLGFESSWPVRGRVDLADKVSVPYLVITVHAAQLPPAQVPASFCLRALSGYQLCLYTQGSVWESDAQPSING